MNNKKAKIIKAVGYIRVSTEEQATDGLSLDNQASRIKAYTDSQGWILERIFKEEGYSGKTLDRPQLKNLLKTVTSNEIDVVLVFRVDRLTRKQKDLWYLLEDVFELHGTGFKSVIEPFDTTTAQGKAFLGMLAVFAQLERDTIAERTKESLSNKKANGGWIGRIPFGFRINKSGQLERDPDEQKVIVKIRRFRNNGFSLRKISDLTNLSYMTISNILKYSTRRRNSLYLKGITVVDCQ